MLRCLAMEPVRARRAPAGGALAVGGAHAGACAKSTFDSRFVRLEGDKGRRGGGRAGKDFTVLGCIGTEVCKVHVFECVAVI